MHSDVERRRSSHAYHGGISAVNCRRPGQHHRIQGDPLQADNEVIILKTVKVYSKPAFAALLVIAAAVPIALLLPTLQQTLDKIGGTLSKSAVKKGSGMAWRSSGASNEALVENLARHGLITQPRVKQAMLGVDRAHYAPYAPYQDSPQSIGHRATISAPHMHASACESLLPYLHPGAKVLDVGSGSGYLTHVLAELVKPGGKVVGIEHIQPLVDIGTENTRKSAEGRELMDNGGIRYVKADGRLGWPEDAPYDAIHVGAAAAGFHQPLIDQLKAPGRLFIPVEENFMQHIYVIDKKEDGTVTKTKDMGVQYVPLTDAPTE